MSVKLNGKRKTVRLTHKQTMQLQSIIQTGYYITESEIIRQALNIGLKSMLKQRYYVKQIIGGTE